MTPCRPYLIRAIHGWIADNGLTPHLLVDVSEGDIVVPVQFARDNRILLNISASATHNLILGNDLITFSARFDGSPYLIRIPVNAVIAIYARENGQGMVFQDEPASSEAESPVVSDGVKKPVLTVVK